MQRTFLKSISNSTHNISHSHDHDHDHDNNHNHNKNNHYNHKYSSYLWSTSDARFFWNHDLIQPFLQIKDKSKHLFLQWIIPCTSAFIGIQRSIPFHNDANYDLLLISRRSRFRAGTRFTRRGADPTGSVANFVETEQLLIWNNQHHHHHQHHHKDKKKIQNNDTHLEIYSHVQTRGSIPLRWSSPADVKTYAPRVRIGIDPLSQARALRRHLVEQLTLYSDSIPNKHTNTHGSSTSTSTTKAEAKAKAKAKAELIFCNLVDKKGDQGRLGRALDSVMKAILDVYSNESIFSYGVEHIWYDFHAECKGGKWYKLQNLLDQIQPYLDSHLYFSAYGNTIHSLQRGVVRTNCMDCLDRTNVVQSLFARYMIFHQLYHRLAKQGKVNNDAGIGTSTSTSTSTSNRITMGRNMPLEYVIAYKKDPLSLPWKKGELSHRAVWADNADMISNLYAGTNALKGDFTRTGQRTKKGMLDDGVNSVTRYYLNNFADAMRQESYDLMTACTPFSFVQSETIDTNTFVNADANDNANDNANEEGLKDNGDHQLHLRWLPGDLKSHTISETMATKDDIDVLNQDYKYDSNTPPSPLESIALASIDHRAGSDRPWWAMDEDYKMIEYGLNTKSIGGVNINTQVSTTGRNGIMSVIGTLIASMNAPNATAIAILLFLGPGLL